MKLDRDPFIIIATKEEQDLILKQVICFDVGRELVYLLLSSLRLDLDNGCWFRKEDWSVYSSVKKIPAHRVSFWAFKGIKPAYNMQICHNCDRRGCINPDHLFQGSLGDNHQDALNKRRVFHIRIK